MLSPSFMPRRWRSSVVAAAVLAAGALEAQRFDPSANPFAGSPDSMQVVPLDEPLVMWVLNYAHYVSLDSVLGSRDHGLHLTLVELPIFGTCDGSGAACEFRYLLTLQADAEGYPPPVWDLGEHQRLRAVQWLPIDSTGIGWDDYLSARFAIEVWPADKSRTRRIDEVWGLPEAYVINVTPDAMLIHRE